MVAAGDPVDASDVNLYSAVAVGTQSPSGTTTSTTFVPALTGVSVLGVSFLAPQSGIVAAFVKATVSNGTAGSYSILDFEIRQGATVGSGTVVRAASENSAGVHQSTTANGQGTITASDIVIGLTPGQAYNIAPMYHVGGGGSTASYNRRQVMILPQLG